MLVERGGEPSSVTTSVMVLLVPPWFRAGVQEKTPLVGLMFAFAGAPEPRLKWSELVGISGSLAAEAMTSDSSTKAAWLLIADSTGGRFTSLTTMTNVFVSDRPGVPLSRTMTVTT